MAINSIRKILRERLKTIRDKLKNQGAGNFVRILDGMEEHTQEAILEIAGERFEKRLAQLDVKIDVKIAEVKSDLIKWMFIFWAGQIGVFFAFLRK